MLCCASCNSSNLQTIEFFEAGDYTITPIDYNHSDNIIVEIWGAGSGGTVSCRKVACNINEFNYYGGNSGAYAKVNIITNMQDFNITVGKGGEGCSIVGDAYYKYYDCDVGVAGGNTSFYNRVRTISIINGVDSIVDIDDGYLLYSYNGNSCEKNIGCALTASPNGYVNSTYTVGYGGESCTSAIGNGYDGGVRVYYAGGAF